MTDQQIPTDTLVLLRNLLSSQTLNVGADDFPETALRVVAALGDLDTEIRARTSESWPTDAAGNLQTPVLP